MNQETRVLIVDDSPTVRADMRTLLGLLTEVQVVGEADTASEALPVAVATSPDVVIIDLEMGGAGRSSLDGLLAIRELRQAYPEISVIVLTVHGYPAAREAALSAGADLFFIKGQDPDGLLQAVRMARASGAGLGPCQVL